MTMMPQFNTDQEYAMKINSSNAHRSKLGFAVRRVRVTGPVEGGCLPFVDLSDEFTLVLDQELRAI
jgi:hypothetical protein